jgi:hypothetical protein
MTALPTDIDYSKIEISANGFHWRVRDNAS